MEYSENQILRKDYVMLQELYILALACLWIHLGLSSLGAPFMITVKDFLSQWDTMHLNASVSFLIPFPLLGMTTTSLHLICHFTLNQFPFALSNIPPVSMQSSVTLPCRINFPATTPNISFIMNYLLIHLFHQCKYSSKARTALCSPRISSYVLCAEPGIG